MATAEPKTRAPRLTIERAVSIIADGYTDNSDEEVGAVRLAAELFKLDRALVQASVEHTRAVNEKADVLAALKKSSPKSGTGIDVRVHVAEGADPAKVGAALAAGVKGAVTGKATV